MKTNQYAIEYQCHNALYQTLMKFNFWLSMVRLTTKIDKKTK